MPRREFADDEIDDLKRGELLHLLVREQIAQGPLAFGRASRKFVQRGRWD
jgi:hypothetical protein